MSAVVVVLTILMVTVGITSLVYQFSVMRQHATRHEARLMALTQMHMEVSDRFASDAARLLIGHYGVELDEAIERVNSLWDEYSYSENQQYLFARTTS